MNLCDVLVHIDEELSVEQRNALEEDMRALPGLTRGGTI